MPINHLRTWSATVAFWRTIAAIVGIGAIALGFYFLGERADENRNAIYKSCVLLDNVIVEATTPKLSQANKVLIGAIKRNAAQLGHPIDKQFAQALKQDQKKPIITSPDCKKAADDPGSIHEKRPPPPPLPHRKR